MEMGLTETMVIRAIVVVRCGFVFMESAEDMSQAVSWRRPGDVGVVERGHELYGDWLTFSHCSSIKLAHHTQLRRNERWEETSNAGTQIRA